jgi:hypothetical protein
MRYICLLRTPALGANTVDDRGESAVTRSDIGGHPPPRGDSQNLSDDNLSDDNGDPIGTRQFVVERGLPVAPGDGLTRAMALLTPDEITELMANRAIIERAKGLLMALYDIDSDAALELLTWRSQETHVSLRAIARQLVTEFPTLTAAQRLPTPAGYDEVLRTAHERVRDDS